MRKDPNAASPVLIWIAIFLTIMVIGALLGRASMLGG